MNRRSFLRGLVAVPVVAALAPLLPKPELIYRPRKMVATITVSRDLALDQQAFVRALDHEMAAMRRDMIREMNREWLGAMT